MLHGSEKHLIETIGKGQQLIVIDFHNEWDFVRVLARNRAEHAEGRSYGVAAAFDGEFYDVLAVEIIRVLREAGAAGMLDSLIHWQDREITGFAQPPVAEHPLQIGQHAEVAVGSGIDAIDKVRSGKIQALLRDFRRLESQQEIRLRAKIGFDFSKGSSGGHVFLLVSRATAKRSTILEFL